MKAQSVRVINLRNGVSVYENGTITQYGKQVRSYVAVDHRSKKKWVRASVCIGPAEHAYIGVANLVARCFLTSGRGCKVIGHKDGDITNVSADNLIIAVAPDETTRSKKRKGKAELHIEEWNEARRLAGLPLLTLATRECRICKKKFKSTGCEIWCPSCGKGKEEGKFYGITI